MPREAAPPSPSTVLGAPGPRLTARIDHGRLAANARALLGAGRGAGLLAVVKADAYGHGAVAAARTLESAEVAGFCVATLAEALELRRAGLRAPTQVFLAVRPADLPQASAAAIDLTVVSPGHLRELAGHLPAHPVGLHLEFDTGMGRSGIALDELGGCLDTLRALRPWLRGAMSHFACADEPDPSFSATQRRRFMDGLAALRAAGLEPPMVHMANSAGCLRGFNAGDTHVRCGIGLYGLCEVEEAAAAGLAPVLSLEAEVLRVTDLPAGSTVGYGRTYTAPGPVRLATLACGYADGFPRALANRSWAGYQGTHFPLVGRVSMDSVTAALPTTVPVQSGDTMELLGRTSSDPNSVVATARLLGTIPYEVTCALQRRVRREPA